MMTIEQLQVELDALDVDVVAEAAKLITTALERAAVPLNEGMITLLGVASAIALQRGVTLEHFVSLAASAYDEGLRRRHRVTSPGGSG